MTKTSRHGFRGGVCPTLNSMDNTGDSRATVVIVFAPGPMVRLGGNIWEGVVPTLRAEAKRGDAEPHLLIIDGRRTNDVRVTTEPVYTLEARMGTGGNNVPVIAFDGYNQAVSEDVYRALRIGIDSGDCIAIPIHDMATRFNGRRGDKQDGKGNGLGIGKDGDPMLTLTQGDRHAVAETTNGEETMQVRRLTPMECERLMGWPDNHTLPRSDGKTNSDTNRYKMCGNGVASPVAAWIGEHIVAIDRR